MRRALLPLLLLTACNSRLCRDPDVWIAPEYKAPRIAAAPRIDGALDDEAWQKAPASAEFALSNVRGMPRQRTTARLAWDDRFLYVAFEVADADIVTPYAADDDPLYESEVVEIFLDADANGATYDEIELSPADKLFDANFVARRQGMNLGWSSGTQHAVRLDGTLNKSSDWDRGWTAEMAIPFDRLTAVPHVPPQAGERWRMNLYRLDHGRDGVQGQAWSPLMVGDFHHLPRFGWLVFGP